MSDDASIPQMWRSSRLIALAMMISGVVYAAILYLIELGEPEPEAIEAMFLPLAGVAVMCAIASFMVPRIMQQSMEQQGAGARRGSSPDQEIRRVIAQHRTTTIISLANCEAIILFGFVLAFLGREVEHIFPFLLAGEALMLIHFPRISAIEGRLSTAAQVRLGQVLS